MNELIAWLKRRYRVGHERVLRVVDDLTNEQMRWQPTPSAHSIAWNVWHLGRWADYLQARIAGMTPRLRDVLGPGVQVWEQHRLATQWGLDPALLGWEETGTDMDDGVAASLPLPAKDLVLGYMRRAFTAAERAVEAIEEQEFTVPHQVPYEREARPVGSFVVSYYAHDERHLGQIVGLRRAMGLPHVLA